MSTTLATIIGGLAIAAITGIVSWVVSSSRTIGRLEAKQTAPAAPTATPAIETKLDEIEKRLTAIQTRLEMEKEYRWKEEDRTMADVTAALRDVDRALKALLDWRARQGS
ncbi:MAG: hypothetical protein V3V34_11725 [Kiloniellales bacterium]